MWDFWREAPTGPQPFGGVKGIGDPRRIRTAILTLRGLPPSQLVDGAKLIIRNQIS